MSRVFWMIVTGLLLAVSVVIGVQHFAAKRGGDQTKLDEAVHQTDSIKKVSAKRDTIFVHSVDTLIKRETVYRTLRDSLVLTDTVQVIKTLAAADTALAQCDTAVKDARQSILTHEEIERGLERQNQLLKSLVPSKTERFLSATKWLAIGAVVGVAFSHR